MNICVFGAGGRTGVEVVQYAKSKGYSVSGFIYSEKSRKNLPSDIKIIKGDILNLNDVKKAIRKSDAVISVVGHSKGSKPQMQTKGVMNIVQAMNEAGIKRILSLTGTGVRKEEDKPSLIDRILNLAVRLVDPGRVNDGVEHAKILQNSNLDWTVVRVLKLSKSNKPFKSYELTEGGPAELLTNRKKVAQVLVDLIDDKKYIGKMPVISG